ncbi:MAG: DUF4234 domain-containing protein [Eubacterium sp.]|nr:DUF4234 domain-containing protein [Eubacterium sp.]
MNYIKKRDVVMGIILTIITCGIYGLYWLYCIADDMNKMTVTGPENTSAGMVLIFSIVTCGIYELFWFYKTGETLDQMKVAAGENKSSIGLLCLLLGVFGLSIVSYAILQSELNKYGV